jgi:hypothetical protein
MEGGPASSDSLRPYSRGFCGESGGGGGGVVGVEGVEGGVRLNLQLRAVRTGRDGGGSQQQQRRRSMLADADAGFSAQNAAEGVRRAKPSFSRISDRSLLPNPAHGASSNLEITAVLFFTVLYCTVHSNNSVAASAHWSCPSTASSSLFQRKRAEGPSTHLGRP